MAFPKEDSFVDFEGKERLFEYSIHEIAIGGYMVKAKEKVENGYEFECYAALNPYEVLGKLRENIKKRLSTRYLQEKNGNLYFSHDEAKGHISYGGVIIDGRFIPFERLSEMIQSYEGFMIELNIKELDSE